MSNILKILIALFLFTIYTSSADEFNPSTHNWNNNLNNEVRQQTDAKQINSISKIENTYKSNDVGMYSYQLKNVPKLQDGLKTNSINVDDRTSNVDYSISNTDHLIAKFKADLRAIGGSIRSYDLEYRYNLDTGLVYAGKPFWLSLTPRHRTGHMKCKVDVDFGDGTKIRNTNYRERKTFSVLNKNPHIYKKPGIYTITLDDGWLLGSCNRYDLTLQVPVIDIEKYILLKQKVQDYKESYKDVTNPKKHESSFGHFLLKFAPITLATVILIFFWTKAGNYSNSNSKSNSKSKSKSKSEVNYDKASEESMAIAIRIKKEDEKKKRGQILATAALALRLKAPTIFAPPGYKVIDMKLTNKFLIEWTIYYVDESKSSIKKSFRVSIGSQRVNVGGVGQFKFKWVVPR